MLSPCPVHLCFQLGKRAAVFDDNRRVLSSLSVCCLGSYPQASLRLAHSAIADQPSQRDLRIGDDDPESPGASSPARLGHQSGLNDNGRVRSRPRGLEQSTRDLFPHKRMNDRVQVGKGCRIAEHDLPEGFSVYASVTSEDSVAEAGNDPLEPLGPRSINLVGDAVGVDHDRAARCQDSSHGRLPGPDPPREADDAIHERILDGSHLCDDPGFRPRTTIGHAAGIVEPSRQALGQALAVALVAACYLLSFHPFARPVILDPATWDYMSLALVEGRVPYRDVFLHKTPGAMFIGAVGAVLSRLAGLPPIAGVHAPFIALGAAGPALTFLLCRRHGAGRCAALAAAVWLLAVDQWSLAAIEGARPKVATTTLGLAGVLVASRRPLLGGTLAGAATLCWQPGLVFALGGMAEAYRHRNEKAVPRSAMQRFCIGATLPFLALLVYLVVNEALLPFVEQAVLFNFHYIDLHARTPSDTLQRLWRLAKQWNPVELILLPAAGVGLIAGRKTPPLGLSIATAGYAALLFISVQAWPDTILLAPGVAVVLGQGLSALFARAIPQVAAATVVIFLGVASALAPGSNRFFPPVSWAEQHDFMTKLATDLSPSDSVYVVSCPEFLIHTGRHSVLPWPYMWFGVDRFAASRTEGGFAGILRRLSDADPQLMIICRRWGGSLRRSFDQWAQGRYRRELIRFYPHTKRAMVVYRRLRKG